MIDTLIKDVLYYLDPHSGSNHDKNQGIVIGVVSTLMSTGLDFPSAIRLVAHNLPRSFNEKDFPEAWRTDILKEYHP